MERFTLILNSGFNVVGRKELRSLPLLSVLMPHE